MMSALMDAPEFIETPEEELMALEQYVSHRFAIYNGDSVELVEGLEDHSIGLSVFSPPFPGMYAYSNSPRDMGNVKSIQEMLDQFEYLIAPDKLMRKMIPGRHVWMHITQAVAHLKNEGFKGLIDFRGPLIKLMCDNGWHYFSETVIEKDPELKAQRTHDERLLRVTGAKDSTDNGMALADILLCFKAPGDNPIPVPAFYSEAYDNTRGWIGEAEWNEWAGPIWLRYRSGRIEQGIRETDVLKNFRDGRENEDEKHLCPLQLEVIRRLVKLYTNPREIVLDPFNGIGSTGAVAMEQGRKYIGFELKPSYFRVSVNNLRNAEHRFGPGNLLDLADEDDGTSVPGTPVRQEVA